MPDRLSLPLTLFFLAALLLVGCGDSTQEVAQGMEGADGVRQAVEQAYQAESVGVALYQRDSGRRLEVNLVNPGGREATNEAAAREVAREASGTYTGSRLESVRVSFEHATASGPAESGLYRRYTFSPGDLSRSSNAADTTTS